MYIPKWKTEKKLKDNDKQKIVGIDEAGRGPLAGPVVASAVMLKEKISFQEKYLDEYHNLIRDSKTLSVLQRKKAFQFIQKNFFVGVGIISQKTIDRINILEATYLAMKSALTQLKRQMQKCEVLILVDGNQIIPNLSLKQKAIKNGDKKIKSIAAASIVAKVTRDKIMQKYALQYPQYNFDKHKGYGTKLHLEALQKYGPTPLHRYSFRPIKKIKKASKYK